MSSSPDASVAILRSPIGVFSLVRVKSVALRNRVSQAIADSPIKFLATVALLGVVWVGLYLLFVAVFMFLKQSRMEAAIAIPMVFSFFFVAMLVMLTVSNAIIAYTSLFAVEEAAYLLSSPVPPRAYVWLKYIETLIFSSWSLILLGLPLMFAMADTNSDASSYYYLFFISFFICFVPIPGAAGLVLAWMIARFLDRNVRRRLIITAALVLAVGLIWTIQSMTAENAASDQWLTNFLLRVNFVQSALLPSSWVVRGVEAAIESQTTLALSYLAVTIANAMFLSVVAVRIVSLKFMSAFDRALSSRGGERSTAASPAIGLAGKVFFYLPLGQRLIAAKDLRTFFRDPIQWTQLVVLFGLMALYLVNVPKLSGAKPLEGWGMVIPFLNFGALSFILATFTSRFVFPLVSLEGQQLWLIGMLPLSPWQILVAKFAFAMTVSTFVAFSTTVLAVIMLKMPPDWAVLQVTVTVATCFGLCGFAVGIGARLPMFEQRNAARIANGFGGTVNLVVSVMLVLTMLSGMGAVGFHNRTRGFDEALDAQTLAIAGVMVVVALAGGFTAMVIGARHLRRAEI
ncbi:MAG: hypothetical protein DHS20C16_00520 [Phycisphaerae bacterium]|nr:MAG: hypothetical protein DHS20C16_00520 [Phycisphaerae bacterium]